MLIMRRLIAALATTAALPIAAHAQDMALGTLNTSGSLGQGLVIEAQPLHALGPAAVTLVAFEIAGSTGSWSMPPANDGGVAGDALAGDGLWSQAADLSGAAPGDYQVVVYMIDEAGVEFVSDPVAVTLN